MQDFSPIGFDVSVLGAYYASRVALRTSASAPALAAAGAGVDPAVTAPWEIPVKASPIASKMAKLSGVKKFIDLKADTVTIAGDDQDAKNLFALYNALIKLRTLAEYGADDKTVSGALKPLDTRFQNGLTEVRDFLKTAAFDKLKILYGEKSNRVNSLASLGKISQTYIGGVAHSGSKDDVLTNLTGNEVLTIAITKAGQTDNITVDLAQIGQPLTLQNLVDYINVTIGAVTTVDGSGNTVEKFRTRFAIEDVGSSQLALKVKGIIGEAVTLSASDSEPALVVAGNSQRLGIDTVESGFLAKFSDLTASSPTADYTSKLTTLAPGQALREPASDSEGADSPPPLADNAASAVALDSQGNSYVVGETLGDIGGQLNRSDSGDVFLSKYDSAGQLLWQRLLGSNTSAKGFAIAVDSNDNVVIAGETDDNLTPTSFISGTDSFVTKFSATGAELWTHQVQAGATDGARALSIDANGDVLVSGSVSGAIDANATAGGGKDAYFSKLDGATGAATFTQQFGGVNAEEAVGVATAADGNILVLANEDGRAVLRKFDVTNPSSEIFSLDLGDLAGGAATSLVVDGSAVYVAGVTQAASLSGGGTAVGASAGGAEGFVTRIDDAGSTASAAYTSFIGSTGEDTLKAITVSGGAVYAVGEARAGVDGQATLSGRDAYVVKLDAATGSHVWAHQFGTSLGVTGATGVAFASQGSSALTRLGLPTGPVGGTEDRTIISQTSAREGDSFFLSINGGAKRKVTIETGDTFLSLAKRINRLSFLYIEATQGFNSSGSSLQIKALRKASIEISAGPEGEDALKSLGLEPTLFIDEPQKDSKADSKPQKGKPKPEVLGGTFGLELTKPLSLRDKTSAAYAITQIDNATRTIQAAFRSLSPNPLAGLTNRNYGPPPPALAAQLANYQAGLARLNSGASTSASLFL